MRRLAGSLFFVAIAAAAPAIAAERASASEARAEPVLVELFTSQSCSSCVPAAAYLEALAARDDVVAIGWHVDYWDQLRTHNGAWRDPYSRAAFTERQRRYNERLRGTRSVYTPQMVVQGGDEDVGSSPRKIEALIKTARDGDAPQIETRREGERIIIGLASVEAPVQAYLVRFRKDARTPVRRGENAGLDVNDVNIATSIEDLGSVAAIGARVAVAAPGEGEGCAVILQRPDLGPVLAAAYCEPDGEAAQLSALAP